MSITAKLQALKIEDSSPKNILSELKDASLLSLWTIDNQELALELTKKKKVPKRSVVIKTLTTYIREAAVKSFLQPLTHDQLDKLLAPAGIKHKQEYTTRPPMKVLNKRLYEQLTQQHDLLDYFTNHFNDDLTFLKEIAAMFELSVDKKADSGAVIQLIVDFVNLQGTHAYLSSIPVHTLSEIAVDERIAKTNVQSADRLVAGIMSRKLPEAKQPAAPLPDMPSLKEIGKKKPIPKSDYWGMWQHYNLTQLLKYCRANDIKTTGTKHEVIERILAWREADKENKKQFMVSEVTKQRLAQRKSTTKKVKSTKQSSSKKDLESDSSEEDEPEPPKEKKKSSPSTEKSKPTEAPKKKEEPKEVVAPKNVPAPAESSKDDEGEEAEEEEEDDEDMKIIDDPSKFSLTELRDFCKRQDLKVKGKSKADIVTLINNTVLDMGKLDRYSRDALLEYCKEQDIAFKGEPTKDDLIKIVAEYNDNDNESEES